MRPDVHQQPSGDLVDAVDGARVIARSSDGALMDRAMTGGLVGTDLHVVGGVVDDAAGDGP